MSIKNNQTISQPRVLVVVKDGVAEAIADSGVNVEVFDWDNHQYDPDNNAVHPAFADLAECAGVPVAWPGYFVTVTQRSPSGAEHDSYGIVTSPDKLTSDMAESVALNFITACDELVRAPEVYGDNVFADCESFDEAHCYWVNSVKPLTAEVLEVMSQYIPTMDYDTLLKQQGAVEIL